VGETLSPLKDPLSSNKEGETSSEEKGQYQREKEIKTERTTFSFPARMRESREGSYE